MQACVMNPKLATATACSGHISRAYSPAGFCMSPIAVFSVANGVVGFCVLPEGHCLTEQGGEEKKMRPFSVTLVGWFFFFLLYRRGPPVRAFVFGPYHNQGPVALDHLPRPAGCRRVVPPPPIESFPSCRPVALPAPQSWSQTPERSSPSPFTRSSKNMSNRPKGSRLASHPPSPPSVSRLPGSIVSRHYPAPTIRRLAET